MLGSKINNLIKLKENGFNIPKFEIIKFEECITNIEEIQKLVNANKDKDTKELSNILKEFIQNNIILKDKYGFEASFYAIRSSANIEDGKINSFAGQFDTYLNISKDQIKEKILECFKSLYNENVLEYCKTKDINISELKMNVIVQEMVNSELSGVVFTANPQGILNESIIVVGEGLGEGIVADKVDTTSYLYNTTDEIYYFEGKKDYLSKKEVETLIYTSKEIEKVLGKYLDIEFAIENKQIYILQARNITTIKDNNPLILDNSNIVESYPNLSLPFTISLVESVYSGVFRGVSSRILKNNKELEKHKEIFTNMVGSSNGRVYYKISNWYTIIKFLPFHKKIIPIWQEMLGVKNKTYDGEKVKLNSFTRFMTYINAFCELAMSQKNMKKLNKKFDSVNKEFYDSISDDMTLEDIFTLYYKVQSELLSAWDVTLLNDTYTFIFTGLLKARLKKKHENYEELANKYISGITNIESLKPIKSMIELAYNKDKINSLEYQKLFNEYILKYGDRNLEELKIESLTFRTNPELLEKKIEEYREDKEKLRSVYNSLQKEGKEKAVKEDLITKLLIKECTSGINNREVSRLNRARIYGMVRYMILQAGKIFEEKGLIKEKRDIFYLTLDEIRSNIEKEQNKQDIIEKRKAEYEMYKLLPAYTRLVFMDKEFNKNHSNINMKKIQSNSEELKGTPCSNGCIRAEALVITDINNIENVKDKILITKMTDPGWVFLLATAKGVIAEKGSLLSHTAIISRELKIPSIVGVEGLLSNISTGDIIEMDGSTGIIKIIKKKEE